MGMVAAAASQILGVAYGCRGYLRRRVDGRRRIPLRRLEWDLRVRGRRPPIFTGSLHAVIAFSLRSVSSAIRSRIVVRSRSSGMCFSISVVTLSTALFATTHGSFFTDRRGGPRKFSCVGGGASGTCGGASGTCGGATDAVLPSNPGACKGGGAFSAGECCPVPGTEIILGGGLFLDKGGDVNCMFGVEIQDHEPMYSVACLSFKFGVAIK